MTPGEQQLSGAAPPPIVETMRPGERLRAAREQAGLSVDQVAQQLKLAPRQVRALEEESFGELPGRTFSRGFMRNYARLLNLDAQDLLAQLPETVQAPLDAPSLNSTTTAIAELPTATAPRASFARWLIPLILVGCIIAAAAYEWYRGGLATSSEPARSASALPPKTPAVAVSQLANPLASAGTPASAAKSASDAPATEAVARPDNPLGAGVSAPGAATGDAPLVLSYSGPSWTEIRDRDGQILVSRLISAGTVESVRGTAPFEVVLGNAQAVSLLYLGKPVELSAYTRQNVARVTLP
ncbi:MAG TPA: RodZ domain-containing protein [Casimicrobiaceae bacterium]|nr:RodZ domain-containing protein [Casimicrobiaceae bacterium]